MTFNDFYVGVLFLSVLWQLHSDLTPPPPNPLNLCDEELQLWVVVPCVLITKLAHFTLFLFFTLPYILFVSKAQLALFFCEEICKYLAATVNHHITPQVILFFIFYYFAEHSIASINSNKCYGVTELWCSTVTWCSRGLFSKSGSEKKNAVGVIFFIQHLTSLRHPICLVLDTALVLVPFIHVNGAYSLLELCSTIILSFQLQINELRICAFRTILAPHFRCLIHFISIL